MGSWLLERLDRNLVSQKEALPIFSGSLYGDAPPLDERMHMAVSKSSSKHPRDEQNRVGMFAEPCFGWLGL